MRVCAIEGCGKPHVARGWCKSHWRRWKVYGDPLGKAVPTLPTEPLVRFMRERDYPRPSEVEGEEMTVYAVDGLCCRELGVHPSAIYGDEWFAAAAA